MAGTRILIATSDTGGGHRALTNALVGAFQRQYGERVVVRAEDVFALPPASLFERATRLYGPCIRLAPWLYGWLYHALDDPLTYRRFARVQGSVQRKLVGLLEETCPDVVVCTHPLANRPLLDAIDRLGGRIPVLATVTELVSVHASWFDPRLRLLNTATTETYQAILQRGASPARVRCVGLPVDERFAHVTATPAALRQGLKLDPDRFTALLIGGGEGAGHLEEIVQAIQRSDLEIQLIVVCGRNESLRTRLERAALRTPAVICGFVKTIPELMQAADVVVTKGGPQTIAEALVVGRPVILTQTLPGQEEGNGVFVESRGVGFGPGPVATVVANLARLVRDLAERERLTRNARRAGRPWAAAQVAEMAVRLAETA